MKYTRFDHMNCSLAQALDIVGERWTLLILRDAFFGSRRFVQFEKSLGIAKNILSARLTRLVEEGIFERRENPESGHTEYVLTDAGLALQPALLALTHWGDEYRPNPKGKRIVFADRKTGKPIRRMAVTSSDGRRLKPRDVRAIPGPGGS